MINLLLATAMMMAINGKGASPEMLIEIGMDAAIAVEAQAYPEEITIQVITPDNELLLIGRCFDTQTCHALHNLNDRGLWQFATTIEYGFEAVDGGPFVLVEGVAATVYDPNLLFEDGFNSGDTSGWSSTHANL